MRPVLLIASIASLCVSVWAGWSHFQGAMPRDRFLNIFDFCVLAWFVLATTWAYTKTRN